MKLFKSKAEKLATPRGQVDLEFAVITAILNARRSVTYRQELETQLAEFPPVSREMTGVGFYLNFYSDVTSRSSAQMPDHVGEASCEYDETDNVLGFILWADKGRVHSLEGFTYLDYWPSDVSGFRKVKAQ